MNKNEFFSQTTIKCYLTEVNQGLSSLPKNVKEDYITEIKADLFTTGENLSKEGQTKNIAEETIASFLPAQELAQAIVQEHKQDAEKNHETNLKAIKLFSGFVITSIAALAVPIILGFMNVSAMLPFILAIILVPIWVLTNKQVLWNDFMFKHWNTALKTSRKVLLILAFGFFAVRLMIVQELTMFTLGYTIVYLIFGYIFITLLKSFSNSKKNAEDLDSNAI